MKSKTEILLELWIEARTRFTNQLEHLTEEDLKKKLLPAQNSVGFILRHIGDLELRFAKNVFGDNSIKVSAKTVIAQHDSGEWTNPDELKKYVSESFLHLKDLVDRQTDEDWSTTIHTKEFGKKTKAEAFGRIISHTAYHAGQIALIKKYGTS
jgi:uncharacterized damage-inducible protein DinB